MDDMVIPVIINGRVERRVLLIARLMATSAPDEALIEADMSRFTARSCATWCRTFRAT